MSDLRILLITNYFPPGYTGGAEVVVYNTCHGLRQRGVEASVLMVNGRMPEAMDRRRLHQGVPVHEVTHQPYLLNNAFLQTFDPRVFRDVLAELRRFEPDLVHIHNVSGATLAPFLACQRAGLPTVLTLHDQWLLCPNNMLYRGDGTLCDPAQHAQGCGRCFRRYDFWANIPRRRQIFARLVQNVRLIISPSQALMALHVAAGYDPARFRVVPNAIEPDLFQAPSGTWARESLRDRGHYQTLLFAGALAKIKGIETVIEAVPLLAKYVDGFRLLVAGIGEAGYTRALRRYEPRVRLLGQVPFQEMRGLYAAADLTLMPSICYENSPMVIYESLMAGTPVLGSAIGGIPELIDEGRTGYLFSPGDAGALAEAAIRHFARSAPERRAMRRRCARQARTHMTLDRHLDRLLAVYDEALGS